MADIYGLLADVMADCDHVAKRDRNEHQRFLFRGIDAVVNAVGPVLRKHRVIVVPVIEETAYDTVATSTGKPATACRVVVAYSFYAPDGSSVTARVAAEAWDSGDKAAPKAMSVAFRTALLQALALPTDEPDADSQTYVRDNAAASQPPSRRAARQPRQTAAPPPAPDRGEDRGGDGITKAQLGKVGAQMRDLGITDRDEALRVVADVVGRAVESRNDLTKQEASKLVEYLDFELSRRAS